MLMLQLRNKTARLVICGAVGLTLHYPAYAEPENPPDSTTTWFSPDSHLHDALERSSQALGILPYSPYTIRGNDWLNDDNQVKLAEDESDDTETAIQPISTTGPCLSLTFDKVHNHSADAKPQSVIWMAPDAGPCQSVATQSEEQQQPLRPTATKRLSLQPKVDKMLVQSMQYLGTPYRLGGSSPNKGFDCSGFVYYNLKKIGVDMPRTAHDQYLSTTPIARAELQPGDLVFFRTRSAKRISHVGIYLGKNRFIHAPSPNKEVQITSLDDRYWTARFVRGGRLDELA